MIRRSRWLRSRVNSDEGFRVTAIIGAGKIYYKQGPDQVVVYCGQDIEDRVDFRLASNPVWHTAAGPRPLTEAERERVTTNTRRALALLGYRMRD